MKKIVIIRHGESTWNDQNRFTGWANIDLTEKGIQEAIEAGELLKREGYKFTKAYTSLLKRANKTLNIILDQMNLDWISVEKSWKLNGRHYGALEGLNKTETAKKYGEDQVQLWRRSYDTPPPILDKNDSRSPLLNTKYDFLDREEIPLGESLKQASERIIPYWDNQIITSLKENDQIIVAAHGNTLRAIVKHIKGISDEDIMSINIPTATPYVFEYDNNLNYINDYYIGDSDKIKEQMRKVANQAG